MVQDFDGYSEGYFSFASLGSIVTFGFFDSKITAVIATCRNALSKDVSLGIGFVISKGELAICIYAVHINIYI